MPFWCPTATSYKRLVRAQELELDRIDAAGDDQVVAHRDPAPVLLGGPPPDPSTPRPVLAEAGGDLTVVGNGRLSPVSRLVNIAALAVSDSCDCSGS